MSENNLLSINVKQTMIEALQEYNTRYGKYRYNVNAEDVDKVSYLRHMIENTRSKDCPIPGDIIIVKGPEKEYPNGHLDNNIDQCASICVEPYTPHVDTDFSGQDIIFETSGGYWTSCMEVEMYVKKDITKSKRFWTWGHCGPCAGGGVYFEAVVNVWELFKEGIY